MVSTLRASTRSKRPLSTLTRDSWKAVVPVAQAFSMEMIGTSTMPVVCRARWIVPGAPKTVPA